MNGTAFVRRPPIALLHVPLLSLVTSDSVLRCPRPARPVPMVLRFAPGRTPIAPLHVLVFTFPSNSLIKRQ
uniref:Putative secreted protein n=1 Tax=Anopheles darlingi TaxID=43151 RepID=A0A2M4DIH6_ANODA